MYRYLQRSLDIIHLAAMIIVRLSSPVAVMTLTKSPEEVSFERAILEVKDNIRNGYSRRVYVDVGKDDQTVYLRTVKNGYLQKAEFENIFDFDGPYDFRVGRVICMKSKYARLDEVGMTKTDDDAVMSTMVMAAVNTK